MPQDVLEAVRAVIISGLNHLVCAAEHLIPASGLFSEVHLASLLTELWDGQLVQLCTGVLGHQPLHKPFYEDLVNDSKGIAAHQIVRRVIGENRLCVQSRRDMSRQLIIPVAIQNVVHQVIHEGDDVTGLVGGKYFPRLRKLGWHILGCISNEHGHNQFFQRGFHIRISEVLLAQLPEVAQKPILLNLNQKFVIFQRTVGHHDPDDFLKGASPGAADSRQETGDDIFLVEVLDLQIVETLRSLLAGKELYVFFDNWFVLFINSQVH